MTLLECSQLDADRTPDAPGSSAFRYEPGMIVTVSQRLVWFYPPPWFVRSIKVLCAAAPGFLFVLGVVVIAGKAGQPPVVTLPDSTDDYVQRMGLCRNVSRVPDNGTDAVALAIYRTCKNLEALEVAYYSRRRRVVNNFNLSFVVTGSGICDADTDVVLLVHSYHDYAERRKAIRETWGGATVGRRWPGRAIRERVRMAFVLGLHANDSRNADVLREDARHADIVQGSFVDSYRNMTLKSIFGLKWVSKYCPSVKYVIKSDDDIIINFPYLLSVLRRTDMKWSIMGPLNLGARVYRKRSKWALSKSEFPFYYFPPYESGSTYVISGDLVQPLLDCSDYVPYIFIDDVYITGILGRILRVRHKRQTGFAYWIDKPPNACDIVKNRVITGNRIKPHTQYALWKSISNDILC